MHWTATTALFTLLRDVAGVHDMLQLLGVVHFLGLGLHLACDRHPWVVIRSWLVLAAGGGGVGTTCHGGWLVGWLPWWGECRSRR